MPSNLFKEDKQKIIKFFLKSNPERHKLLAQLAHTHTRIADCINCLKQQLTPFIQLLEQTKWATSRKTTTISITNRETTIQMERIGIMVWRIIIKEEDRIPIETTWIQTKEEVIALFFEV